MLGQPGPVVLERVGRTLGGASFHVDRTHGDVRLGGQLQFAEKHRVAVEHDDPLRPRARLGPGRREHAIGGTVLGTHAD